MKILILGIDGYLGWPTALRMIKKDHRVYGIDNLSKRTQLKKNKVISAFKINEIKKRITNLKKYQKNIPVFFEANVTERTKLNTIIRKVKPDVIFNFAHIPSAPYSMANAERCIETWRNNTEGHLNVLWAMKEFSPKTHLIKLGTMGEYGTPNVPIPEGTFHYKSKDGKYHDKLFFPRQAGSFYHQSKVANTHNMAFACKIWNLKGTDIMQAIIYGTKTKEIENFNSKTMFYFDETFGTVINRMIASVIINHPLPIYGKGNMKRGILSLSDAVDCYELIMNSSADSGEYRVINQFDEAKSIQQIASEVMRVSKKMNYNPKIKFYKDPRVEKQKHLYKPESKWLKLHGYKRNYLFSESVKTMLEDLAPMKKTIKKYQHVIKPKTKWK
jgi:UDP-sulfoquinovose synthase